MKRIIVTISILAFFLSSCSKWLDVKPEDRFIEEEVFKTPQGFIDALNGIYINIGSNNLYGSELTLDLLDNLAKYYYISPSHSEVRQGLQTYNYSDEAVRGRLDAVWSSMFTNILNINRFIENLDTYGRSILEDRTLAIMEGEALAVRAHLYFDLMRLFAPSFEVDPLAERIPYYENSGYQAASFVSSTYLAEQILADLSAAEDLLKNTDPAREMETVDQTTGAVDMGSRPYMAFRNYHLNYYAVKGLQARVNLYIGEKSTALTAAKAVIEEQSKFPWVKSDEAARNKIFSTECLFAYENNTLYNRYNSLFSPALADNSILAAGPNPNFLNAVYNNWENDYRYGLQWQSIGGKTYYVFLKYADLANPVNQNYRFTIPGIKLSEIFLIAAECEPDAAIALDYLNELRLHRNCPELGDYDNLETDIANEYRREFYGEGQLWYYYKRKNTANILSATTGNEVSISQESYTFPIPLSETEAR